MLRAIQTVTLLALFTAGAWAQSTRTAAADSMDRKLRFIESNAQHNPPSQTPTVITEDEVNAYFAAGRVNLPVGVHRVHFTGRYPDNVTAYAEVNFDEITADRRSSNPLLSLFSGTHEVMVVAHAVGSGGEGRVNVQSVELDGNEIPRAALEYFVRHYIQPKHPEIGLDSNFKLPDRIDIAQVGTHKLTVTQK